MGLPVSGLTGGLSLLKLKTPGLVSCRSLPQPWPVSSCRPTCTSNAGSRYFWYSSRSASEIKGIFSLGALALRTLPRDTFLNPSFWRMSSKLGLVMVSQNRLEATRLRETHMLMPAGMPEPAKVSTSRDVKSGERNWSFSKSAPHGSRGMKEGDFSTSSPKARVRSTDTLLGVRLRHYQ